MQFTPPAVPSALRKLQGWLCWRFVQHEGEPKPRKVSFYASGGVRWGGHGTERDRARLATFEAACAAASVKGFDGVGFAPMPEWGITALDFDDCVAGGRVHPDVLDAVAGTYAEFSPSGNGVRAFVVGQVGNRKSRATEANGLPFGYETFSSKGYVTVTGNALPLVGMLGLEDTIATMSERAEALCVERFGRAEASEAGTGDAAPLGLTDQQLRDALAVLDPESGYEPWLKVGMALHHETRGEGFELWDAWSARGSSYPDSEVLQAKWDSFGRGGQRPTTVHYLLNLANEHGAAIDTTSLALADFDVIEAPAEDFGMVGGPVEAQDKPLRFAVVPGREFVQRPAPSWLVKGVVPQAELLILFGESGAGKSFVALDLFGAVARGVPWRGQRVKQKRVVYIAAEGAGGFRNRMVAYETRWGCEPGFGVIHAAPNLRLREDALAVARSVHAYGGADVVIVDTLAQVSPGADENGGKDMGPVLDHCRGISRALGGALVVLVHHAGKDTSKGSRGWSGLKAAVDAEIEVARTPGGRLIRISKQKDGEDGQQWGFGLDVVQIGADEDGDPITSCVVVEAEAPVLHKVGPQRKLGPVEAKVAEVIGEMAVAQNAGIEVEAVVAEAAARLAAGTDGKKDTRRQRVRRAITALCAGDDSPYMLEDGCISIV